MCCWMQKSPFNWICSFVVWLSVRSIRLNSQKQLFLESFGVYLFEPPFYMNFISFVFLFTDLWPSIVFSTRSWLANSSLHLCICDKRKASVHFFFQGIRRLQLYKLRVSSVLCAFNWPLQINKILCRNRIFRNKKWPKVKPTLTFMPFLSSL